MKSNVKERLKQYEYVFESIKKATNYMPEGFINNPNRIMELKGRIDEYISLSNEYCGYLRALVDLDEIDQGLAYNKLINAKIAFGFDGCPGFPTPKIF